MSPNPSESSLGKQVRNGLIILIAVVLAVAVTLGWRSQTTATSLPALAESAIPLEVAQSNDKPTLMEFYANWCASCQAMAADLSQLKQQYGQQVNFVMLNVDNSKWLPELVRYRVDGIPHFVFLDAQNQELGSVIGRQPLGLMAENLSALVETQPLPHLLTRGTVSQFSTPTGPSTADPRSHGGLPQ